MFEHANILDDINNKFDNNINDNRGKIATRKTVDLSTSIAQITRLWSALFSKVMLT